MQGTYVKDCPLKKIEQKEEETNQKIKKSIVGRSGRLGKIPLFFNHFILIAVNLYVNMRYLSYSVVSTSTLYTLVVNLTFYSVFTGAPASVPPSAAPPS